ncbi:hypothetical protein [uncultured Methanobrevibacter sp.]|uniref:hypothetical protein n=1 Tax=uncultured Methanobrevibacter sp. TaxID=253161 RepID=UPI00261B9CB6|nr:hypothetical protein [uncultured Methanobrevibacter sp.]
MNNNSKRTKIQQIVSEIMRNKITTMPFDFLFRDNIAHYPETNHKLLGLPGIFKNIEDTNIFIKGCGNLNMDHLESVLPDDGMIKREAAINVEQETGKIKNEKIEVIFNYWLNTMIKLKKPCYPFVATNYEYKSKFLVGFVEGFLFIIYLIIFYKKRLYKILNTLNEKDYSKEEFSKEDYVQFTYCMIFAKKPYAEDMMERLTMLFTSIENINKEFQYDLHTSLCMMIKYHFNDDEKIMELITMITEKMQEEEMEKLSFIERMKTQLAEGEIERKQLKSEISKKDSELSKKDDELSKKDKKIEYLQTLLINNNIIF